MSEWSDRSISTLLFKQASAIKMEVCVFVIIIIVISEKVPSSYYDVSDNLLKSIQIFVSFLLSGSNRIDVFLTYYALAV